MSDSKIAQRTVTGVIAGMVAATAIATGVGFWLSYAGLHDFALRAGLHGPEAWAWPASVDLFILAGEAGVTISALRRAEDWQAWAYLAIGFGASVTANVLHVDPSALFWTRYAVAAVPPIAAMLALAALLRQVYRLAEHAAPGPRPSGPKARTRTRSPKRTRSAPVTTEVAESEFMSELAAGVVPSQRQIRARLHIGQDRARQLHEHLESVVTASAVRT